MEMYTCIVQMGSLHGSKAQNAPELLDHQGDSKCWGWGGTPGNGGGQLPIQPSYRRGLINVDTRGGGVNGMVLRVDSVKCITGREMSCRKDFVCIHFKSSTDF